MAKKADVTKMQAPQAKPITAAVLVAFFNGDDAAKVADKVHQAEQSRLQYLAKHFASSELSDVKEAVKGLKDQAKEQHGDKSPQARTAGVRASNIQSLYGAYRFAGLKIAEVKGGYHDVVAKAVETLREQGIKWTGDKVQEKWERDVRKRVAADAQAELAAEMEREKIRRTTGEELSPEQLEAIRVKAMDEQRRAGAVNMAQKLYAKQGPEFCQWLIDALEAAMVEGAEKPEEERKAA